MSKTYKVSVEKRLYCTGVVVTAAKDADNAIKQVRALIDKGELQTTQVEWSDPEYEDSSFDATGDVD